MEQYKDWTDQQIVEAIAAGKHQVYEFLFKTYYADLVRFALKYLRKPEVAEGEVQNLFLYIWEKRSSLNINTSLKSYLFTATKNRSFNYLKSSYAKQEIQHEVPENQHFTSDGGESTLEENELKTIISTAIESLPTKCRTIFTLSREGGLTYQEIAEHLDISKKTVEAQMGIALKKLRAYLQTHWEKITLVFILLSLFPEWFV